jgi:RHS repeat-associated protein
MAGLLSALLLSVGLGSVTPPPPALPTISAPAAPSSLADSVVAPAFAPSAADPHLAVPYFGARYYASRIGRFTTVDPVYTWQENLVDPQRWNRYAYARNNPLRYTDPDGRTIIDYFGGVINAFGSDLVFGAGRSSGGNSDFQFGQTVGDSLSLVAAGFEAKLGGGLVVGGGFATATVAGAEVGVPALAAGAGLVVHGAGVGATAVIHLSKNSTLSPGEHAGESIPARGPQRDFRAGERAEVNRIGGETGCHTCGTSQPGTKSGNFVPDHQPPNRVNNAGDSQRLYPHCINCSRQQGGEVSAAVRREQ